METNGNKERLEDNPVPSIVKDILHVCTWYQGRDVTTCKRVEAYAKSLQNGVETAKEQPKCKGLKCKTCINYCTVTGSDSEM